MYGGGGGGGGGGEKKDSMGVRAPQLLVCRSDRPGNATAPAGWAPLTFGTTWRQTKGWGGGVAWVRAAVVRRGATPAGYGQGEGE